MLAEGFLRVLRYREERKFTSTNKQKKRQINPVYTDSILTDSAQTVPNQEELESTQTSMLQGLFIPGSSPANTLHPVCIEDCSLLEQYPDLQVADSGRISHNPLRTTDFQHGIYINSPISEVCLLPEPGDAMSSIPDQGYLVMGASVNIGLDLPGSGLEPMSNSVLNGLLEKQLEEVYMQHLTDNLARCNSHLGNSLLHGLVPPPQPSRPPRGPDSLEASLEESSGERRNKISYLSTQNLVPCSSNFSSPVLRISEADNPHLQ